MTKYTFVVLITTLYCQLSTVDEELVSGESNSGVIAGVIVGLLILAAMIVTVALVLLAAYKKRKGLLE